MVAVIAVFAFTGQRTIEADKSVSTITYHVDHLFHSVDGVCTDVTSEIIVDSLSMRVVSVSISAPVSSFNSGNSSRDNTAMKAIESTKYPSVSFVSDSVTYRSDSTFVVFGTLEFHGVKKNIVANVLQTRGDKRTIFDGSFEAEFSDFNIDRPALVFIPINNSFSVKFHVVLTERI